METAINTTAWARANGGTHHTHPEPIRGEENRPGGRDGFPGAVVTRIGAAFDLFYAHQPFAYDELNQFQKEKDRGGEGDDRDRIHGKSGN